MSNTPMEKFLAVEDRINSIFDILMSESISEGDRMTHFVEKKVYLEKIQTTLRTVAETGDAVLKGKSEALLVKIEERLKTFGVKYLGIVSVTGVSNSDSVHDTSIIDAKEHVSQHVSAIDESHIHTNIASQVRQDDEIFFIVVNHVIVETFTGTMDSLLNLLNSGRFAGNQLTIIKGVTLNLTTKTVFAL